MSTPGRFITFEGGEGAGKSTQIPLICNRLEAHGLMVATTREPGGSEGAELIRELLVTGDVNRWDSVTEALLYNAARRDHLERTIKPMIAAGTWVVCDRFADSTMAYQGYGHGLPTEQLDQLYTVIAGDFKPDHTFIFDLPPRVGLERTSGRTCDEDRFERMNISFHERLREGFIKIAEQDAQRYTVLDASLDVNQISDTIYETICQKFSL
ncbi:MAG: dTMP kinase [Alphaproteobacteria bacterium]